MHLWNKESSTWVETSSLPSLPSALEQRVANPARLLESPYPTPTLQQTLTSVTLLFLCHYLFQIMTMALSFLHSRFFFFFFFFFYHSASAARQQDFIKKREYIQKYLLASAFCFSDSLNEIMFLSCLFLHTEMTDNVNFVPFTMNRVEKCSLSSRNTSWQIYRSLYHCWQRIKGKSVHYLSPLWQVHINLGSRLISDSLSIWSLRLKAKSPFQVTLFYVFKFKIFQLMYLIVQKMKFTIGNSWNF